MDERLLIAVACVAIVATCFRRSIARAVRDGATVIRTHLGSLTHWLQAHACRTCSLRQDQLRMEHLAPFRWSYVLATLVHGMVLAFFTPAEWYVVLLTVGPVLGAPAPEGGGILPLSSLISLSIVVAGAYLLWTYKELGSPDSASIPQLATESSKSKLLRGVIAAGGVSIVVTLGILAHAKGVWGRGIDSADAWFQGTLPIILWGSLALAILCVITVAVGVALPMVIRLAMPFASLAVELLLRATAVVAEGLRVVVEVISRAVCALVSAVTVVIAVVLGALVHPMEFVRRRAEQASSVAAGVFASALRPVERVAWEIDLRRTSTERSEGTDRWA